MKSNDLMLHKKNQDNKREYFELKINRIGEKSWIEIETKSNFLQ